MSSLATKPNDEINSLRGGFFEVDEQGLAALGVRLVAGRPFEQSEVLPPAESVTASMPQQIIITQAFADALFPNQNDCFLIRTRSVRRCTTASTRLSPSSASSSECKRLRSTWTM
jgi:hypothetical protein